MPRISPSLVRSASRISPLLPRLLPVCRTLQSAEQELRWIQAELPQDQWIQAVIQRSRHVPLQYILGTQPFGHLEILCEKETLIPRWETEEWATKICQKLKTVEQRGLKIVDFCTGTGCVALLMASLLQRSEIFGKDVSPFALNLSRKNQVHCHVANVDFTYGDVFDPQVLKDVKMDLVTANPPYISFKDYKGRGVERSVRSYEPKLALVGGNEFYTALVANVLVPSQARGFVFELGYESQFKHTESILPSNWECKLYYDGAGQPRCVIGWIKGSDMQCLKDI